MHSAFGGFTAVPGIAAAHQPAALSGTAWRRRYQVSLLASDSVLIVGVLLLAVNVLTLHAGIETLTDVLGLGGTMAVGWLTMMSLFRTRDARLVGTGAGEYKKVIRASSATFAAAAVAVVLLDLEHFRGLLVLALPSGTLLLLSSRWLWRQWLVHQSRLGHYLSKVVVVGRPTDVRYVAAQLAKNSGAAYTVVGAVYEGRTNPAALQTGDRVVPVISGLRKIEDFVALTGADAVIVAGHLRKGSSYIRELGWRLEGSSTELVLASALTNVAGPRITMRPVEGLPLMHVELPHFTGGRHVLKRAMDIVLSATALVVLAPLFLVLSVAIRLDSPGPAFFVQERAGKDSAVFRMVKFRSMVTTAEDELELLKEQNEGSGVLFKMRDDPRVTRIGRIIRKYSLDELPQFWNVLRGDMSLVGPRPPLVSEVSGYEEHTHRRLLIKPGLTGLWQVSGRSDLDWEESIRLDLYYVENWSVAGDLIIMWRTFKVMLQPVGAY
ncbi:sugar transferase [Arthrobacter burdickii]|uniref:Sugar transferase n=1 Tax=Arthrobacter burdickii TaxID=3035920 RepID=A0ABT8K6E8_9MICC|nr:sugar transferase [Arthrobacter burdickii]MDN4612592.1 sugar transferase [Arthrobacter burdickii]